MTTKNKDKEKDKKNEKEKNQIKIKVVVSEKDFSIDSEYDFLSRNAPRTGAIVSFVGRVREFSEREDITGLHLEHYPGMTEASLNKIIELAHQRWDIQACSLHHRIGSLQVEDQIVYVGISCAHRDEAFDACRFIMDYLKTEAPFWKKELTQDGDYWVDAREKDQQARARWQSSASDQS